MAGEPVGCACLLEYDIAELEQLYDTVLALNREYAKAQLELAQINLKLQQREAQIIAASLTDPLTGAGNRRRLEQALTAETNRADRTGTKLIAFIADLDHFKLVNDTTDTKSATRCSWHSVTCYADDASNRHRGTVRRRRIRRADA